MAGKIISVVGARPNFIKIAPVMEQLEKNKIDNMLVHTGQHYDTLMSGSFFKDLKIPEPDINLNVGSLSHAKQSAEIMSKLEDIFIKENPSLVVAVGDVNSTLAAALTASKLRIKVAHIEAGLRSFELDMPEEINRLLTDQVSNLLFCTEQSAVSNLEREGIGRQRIFFVGNVMIDTLMKNTENAMESDIRKALGIGNGEEYCIITAHRPENVDNEDSLSMLADIIGDVQKKIKVIYPVHPRTLKMLNQFGLYGKIKKMKGLRLCSPLGYLDFLCLAMNSKFCITDSGGLQEETSYLKVPCLTIRKNTERPVTVEKGTNTVTGLSRKTILSEIEKIISGRYKKGSSIGLWDGSASQRIVKIIADKIK